MTSSPCSAFQGLRLRFYRQIKTRLLSGPLSLSALLFSRKVLLLKLKPLPPSFSPSPPLSTFSRTPGVWRCSLHRQQSVLQRRTNVANTWAASAAELALPARCRISNPHPPRAFVRAQGVCLYYDYTVLTLTSSSSSSLSSESISHHDGSAVSQDLSPGLSDAI